MRHVHGRKQIDEGRFGKQETGKSEDSTGQQRMRRREGEDGEKERNVELDVDRWHRHCSRKFKPGHATIPTPPKRSVARKMAVRCGRLLLTHRIHAEPLVKHCCEGLQGLRRRPGNEREYIIHDDAIYDERSASEGRMTVLNRSLTVNKQRQASSQTRAGMA